MKANFVRLAQQSGKNVETLVGGPGMLVGADMRLDNHFGQAPELLENVFRY
ncbi:MAG TPA: hypothetical protein VGW37_11360 [Terriglobia bacterium]|nr:hypothetical protein [Terriglobia bacterium]